MKKLMLLTLLTSTAAVAQPAAWMQHWASIPNSGGTLYVTHCTALGWPCRETKITAFGQICYAEYAQRAATSDEGRFDIPRWPFTVYTSWRCAGFTPSAEARKFGYSEGGKVR